MSASAFVRRDVPSRLLEPLDAAAMQPLDSNLLPKVFSSAFGLPVTRFDQVDASLAGVAPVFKLPLPFAGATNESRVDGSAATAPTPDCTVAAHCPQEVGKLAGDSHAHQCRSPATQMEAVSTDHADGKPLHKPRVVWTDELHQRFLRAIEAAGSEEAAVPTVILRLMNVSGLSRDNVASHLQKHRLGLKRSRSRKRPAVDSGNAVSAAAKGKRSKRSGPPSATAAAAGPGTSAPPVSTQQRTACHEREGSNPNANEGSCGRSGSGGGGGANVFNASGSDDGAGAGSDNRNSCIETAAQSHGLATVCVAGPTAPPPPQGAPTAAGEGNASAGAGDVHGSGQGSNTDNKGYGTEVRASTGGMSSRGSGGARSGTAPRDAGNSRPSADATRQASESTPAVWSIGVPLGSDKEAP